MKRKFYMRGLGTGILVTAIIMSISSGQKRPMTDEEVKARARELGMVESTVLSNLQGSVNGQPEETQTPESGTEPEETKEPDGTTEPVETQTPDSGTEEMQNPDSGTKPEETKEPGDTTEPAETTNPDGATEPAETAEPEETPNAPVTEEERGDMVTIVIKSGESSVSVSKSLAEAGLVESASDYDRYLCQNGYDKKIRVGTYEIQAGASEEEIAKIITGGKR